MNMKNVIWLISFSVLVGVLIFRLVALEIAYVNLRGDILVDVNRFSREGRGSNVGDEELKNYNKDSLILLTCGTPFYISSFLSYKYFERLRAGLSAASKGRVGDLSNEVMCEGDLRDFILNGKN